MSGSIKKAMMARSIARECLQMAAKYEQEQEPEKANDWRKEASTCLRVSADYLRESVGNFRTKYPDIAAMWK